MSSTPADAAARERALDPTVSFIVQAPAGSGKTSLLIQRYLALLARAEQPEEIVAITFTRKAAAEMRRRLLEALAAAAAGEPPADGHTRRTYELARDALARERSRGWSLPDYPSRLRIQTIDALCAGIARQMPWVSRFGGAPRISEDAEPLYREAALATLALLEEGGAWSVAVADLLGHLDNNAQRLEWMLVEMLKRRDQWLRHLVDPETDAASRRERLETALAAAVERALGGVRACVPPGLADELVTLAAYAGANLKERAPESAAQLGRLTALPGAGVENLAAWQALATLLLTTGGEWRQRYTVAQGFPGGKQADVVAMKARVTSLVEALAAHEDFRVALQGIRTVPQPVYGDGQWQALEALSNILPVAAAQLRVVFGVHGRVDFMEVAQAAVAALGASDDPTDLALALDYRIRHILVDEFQDTSVSQFELLAQLTAGWTAGDGRTLFAVGDPMQSIYRFREADVGLYLRARHQGIGEVKLEPLTLTANFRSDPVLVDWVNRVFPVVFPAVEEPTAGAVSFAPSTASGKVRIGAGVAVDPVPAGDGPAQARRVVELVQEARRENPDGKVAVLVRSRSHLNHILPALQAAGLRYQAMDIEPLGARPVVQDLFALTRALLHPADRVAWLAVLRAPWCGMTLADLHGLAAEDLAAPIPALTRTADGLSADGLERLVRVRTILETAFAERRRRRLRRWVEGTWLALGGPACVDDTDLEDARVFLNLLDKLDAGGELEDLRALHDEVGKLSALPDVHADDRLQIMTMHKAKGLEFDTVILPGLERTPPPETERLLTWVEQAGAAGTELQLAPVSAAGGERDAITGYLRELEKEKIRFESVRLLYVAVTRARRRLHLVAALKVDEAGGEPRAPDRRSLLAPLWPAIKTEFVAPDATPPDEVSDNPPRADAIQRLPLAWSPGLPPAVVTQFALTAPAVMEEAIEFEWVGDTARHVGTVVHRYLHRMGEQGLDQWGTVRVRALRGVVRSTLRHLGVTEQELDAATARVEQALTAVYESGRARWLLSPEHREARNEYALTAVIRDRTVNVVIDRTFVDATGARWIVDYKTSTHLGGGLESFLDREQERYRKQLETYARVMALLEQRPIKLGLYFPLLDGWREWPAPGV